MNEFIDYKTASMIMGLNVIGPKELDSIEQKLAKRYLYIFYYETAFQN